eukprot:CAMPEP_0195577676 /NCGR_PEP_ID=MMETSP0814-20130614/10760_1 /TAXON_ID=97485 /ORGANISM="Prymnesium parvum, Strain Texoma1" /LENGTH=70 /DNA_ID=CAMNT_0040714093 /DNA_START=18 /DNA_END=226 /DNA_ORIENTATION=-
MIFIFHFLLGGLFICQQQTRQKAELYLRLTDDIVQERSQEHVAQRMCGSWGGSVQVVVMVHLRRARLGWR